MLYVLPYSDLKVINVLTRCIGSLEAVPLNKINSIKSQNLVHMYAFNFHSKTDFPKPIEMCRHFFFAYFVSTSNFKRKNSSFYVIKKIGIYNWIGRFSSPRKIENETHVCASVQWFCPAYGFWYLLFGFICCLRWFQLMSMLCICACCEKWSSVFTFDGKQQFAIGNECRLFHKENKKKIFSFVESM